VQLTGRVALEDIDDLGGKKIPKGESVLCLLGSRQPRPGGLSRPGGPSRYHPSQCAATVLRRRIHFCLGAQLARIEAEIAIGTLLRPACRICASIDAENPEWRPTFVLRSLKRLPASW